MTPSTVLGVDAGSGTLREADHLLAELAERFGLAAGVIGCTHLVRTDLPHVAVSLALPDGAGAASGPLDLTVLPEGTGAVLGERRRGPAELADGAALAAAEHARSGRAVLFPGASLLTGTLTVAEILDRSAIERISVLMGGEPAPGVRVDTRGHVRPEWRDGRLTLLTMPAADGLLAPYEVPGPTPCCATHAQ